ncbi:unnamed protein product [Rhodiola kirilowii]
MPTSPNAEEQKVYSLQMGKRGKPSIFASRNNGTH